MLMLGDIRQVLSALPKVSVKTFPTQSSRPSFSQSLLRLKHKASQLWRSSLKPMRGWLESIEIVDSAHAHLCCRLIPAQCPFERNIQLGTWNLHIPPLCKLNPFYEELVILRFRALSFLVDECGEDVTCYCQTAPKG
jgi:hypothetical protein